MICIKRKLLFLHVPKTGGTSIERTLFPNLASSTAADYSYLSGWDDDLGWLNHLTLDQAIGLLPGIDLKNYLVFTVVRNPWDRLVSEYCWKKSISDLQISFPEYVHILHDGATMTISDHYKSRVAFDQHYQPQTAYLEHSAGVLVRIIRFEEFDKDVTRVLRNYIPKDRTLPRLRSSNHVNYKQFYSSESIEMVRHLYVKDIERFGYVFENS